MNVFLYIVSVCCGVFLCVRGVIVVANVVKSFVFVVVFEFFVF